MQYVLSDPYGLTQTEDAKKIGNGIVVNDLAARRLQASSHVQGEKKGKGQNNLE